MPNLAYLAHNVYCPACDALLMDLIPFQWGVCPGYTPREEYLYTVGDAIQWQQAANGKIPAWTYIDFDDKTHVLNAGDPMIQNLYVRMDSPQSDVSMICLCGHTMGGVAIRIKDGSIDHVWIYPEGTLSAEADIYLLDVAGENIVRPMVEWDDYQTFFIKEY